MIKCIARKTALSLAFTCTSSCEDFLVLFLKHRLAFRETNLVTNTWQFYQHLCIFFIYGVLGLMKAQCQI